MSWTRTARNAALAAVAVATFAGCAPGGVPAGGGNGVTPTTSPSVGPTSTPSIRPTSTPSTRPPTTPVATPTPWAIVYIIVATIVVIVQAGQFLGNWLARRALRRR